MHADENDLSGGEELVKEEKVGGMAGVKALGGVEERLLMCREELVGLN